MQFIVLTLFPEIIQTYLQTSIIGRAVKDQKIQYQTVNIRDYSPFKYKSVDDRPYGGGSGMVMRADILEPALQAVFDSIHIPLKTYDRTKLQVVMTTAGGKQYSQSLVKQLVALDYLILICGHYEGVDQRFIDQYCDLEISIGPYVLTGGELPALTILDSVSRYIPGVLGNRESLDEESHTSDNYLEYPQYTRPEIFNQQKVPEILLSGNHASVKAWRTAQSLKKTEKEA